MIPKSICAVALIALLGFGCSKLGSIAPPPITTIQSLEQTPWKTYLDSLFGATSQGVLLTIEPVQLNNALLEVSAPGSGQAVIAYAFRSSVPGAVTSLGIFMPTTGPQHNVTLWDSASGQVLALAQVPSLDSGHWTYVSLALANQAVVIEANHGYIVGFNSLAIGDQINVPNPNNGVYFMDGIYTNINSNTGGGVGKVPIVPFTEGAITYENYYTAYYDDPNARPPYPGTSFSNPFGAFDLPGVCDIGFIPAP